MLIKVGAGGVNLSFLHEEMWLAIKLLCYYYNTEELVITETNKGNHLPYSKHYQNRAIDVRKPKDMTMFTRMKDCLNDAGFDCVEEKTHIHIEFDPKEE